MEVMVADVIVETPDTASLVLFTGNDRLDYKAGHFLTIDPHQFDALQRFTDFMEHEKGQREPPRAYSLASAPHEKNLILTVKEERYIAGVTPYPPLLSPFLVSAISRGIQLEVTGFSGPYTLPDDVDVTTDHIVHVCAGSGGVPNFSIVKHVLREHPRIRQTFIYSNKTWQDIIFRRELRSLQAGAPDRLRVVHTLTREQAPPTNHPDVRRGRVDRAMLSELIPDPRAALVFACGPGVTPWDRAEATRRGRAPGPRFLESVTAALKDLGVPDTRITRESYG
jgi:ferredoxin-NADP reductase